MIGGVYFKIGDFEKMTDEKMIKLSAFREAWFGVVDNTYLDELNNKIEYVFLAYVLQTKFNSSQRYNIAMNYLNKIEHGECKDEEEATQVETIITACIADTDIGFLSEKIRYLYKTLNDINDMQNSVETILKEINSNEYTVFNDQTKEEIEEPKKEEPKYGFTDQKQVAERSYTDLNGGKGDSHIHTR